MWSLSSCFSMIATASCSLKPMPFSRCSSVQIYDIVTGQVEEVRVLVEFVEDGARSILQVCAGKKGDRVWR
jgi:hypothetical protein